MKNLALLFLMLGWPSITAFGKATEAKPIPLPTISTEKAGLAFETERTTRASKMISLEKYLEMYSDPRRQVAEEKITERSAQCENIVLSKSKNISITCKPQESYFQLIKRRFKLLITKFWVIIPLPNTSFGIVVLMRNGKPRAVVEDILFNKTETDTTFLKPYQVFFPNVTPIKIEENHFSLKINAENPVVATIKFDCPCVIRNHSPQIKTRGEFGKLTLINYPFEFYQVNLPIPEVLRTQADTFEYAPIQTLAQPLNLSLFRRFLIFIGIEKHPSTHTKPSEMREPKPTRKLPGLEVNNPYG